MLERTRKSSRAIAEAEGDTGMSASGMGAGVAAVWDDGAIDNELQAAIEYKIASSGVLGAETVLDLLNAALRRLLR